MSHSDDPDLWLRHARDDLEVADAEVAVHLRCYHAQQAAEKSIKAVLLRHGIDFPWVHDIAHLTGLLPQDARVPALDAAAALTDYATAARYPQRDGTFTHQHASEAADLARVVVHWAASIIDPI